MATDQQLGGLAVSLMIDRVTASRLGVAPTTIDNTLYDVFGQRQISTMYTQVNQYHVVLEGQPQFQTDPNKLNHLYIQSSASAEAASGGRGFHFVRVVRVLFRRFLCSHGLRSLYSLCKLANAAPERALIGQQ